MSYPLPPGSNGAWNGNDPPNANPYAQRTQTSPNGTQHSHPYYPPSNNGYAPPQQYAQRSASSPSYSDGYRATPQPQKRAQPPPQAVNPQFINPSELFQQPQPSYQNGHHSYEMGQRTSSQNASANMTTQRPEKIDQAALLMSLAEEFFDAAHAIAPSVAGSMTTASMEEYQKLIATGLGILETLLKKVRLNPRVEANIRLRYAGVLYEETDNYMQAEEALSKGIVLCDRNHYYDVKYAMQFLLAQIMFRKSPKAAIKALDLNISDAQTYQHISWVYALRFLRASHSLASGSLADSHSAIENLQKLAGLAQQQGDHEIVIASCLMEAMAYLKSSGPAALEGAHRALGVIRQFQFQNEPKIPQLIGLANIIDVVCSIREGMPNIMLAKLKAMQEVMDVALQDPDTWSRTSDRVAIPINRTPNSSQVVSSDTRMILAIGNDGRDNLMLSFLNMRDAYALTFLLCGIVWLNKNSQDQKAVKFLAQGLKQLESTNSAQPSLLPDRLSYLQWRGKVLCYFCSYLAFCAARLGDWATVKNYVEKSKVFIRGLDPSLQRPFESLAQYLTGVYYQGTGDLDNALEIFQDERFDLSTPCGTISSKVQVEHDFAILAALNSLWIFQEPCRFDTTRNAATIAQLKEICQNHPNKEIQAAFHLAAATTTIDKVTDTKAHLSAAMKNAQQSSNVQFTSIALVIMCSRFFANVVGEQAEKSAMAASVQAGKSGNELWMAVADGLLAQSFQLNGKLSQAEARLEKANQHAQKSMPAQAP